MHVRFDNSFDRSHHGCPFFGPKRSSGCDIIFLSALAGALITVIIYSSRSVKKALAARKTLDDTAPKITGPKNTGKE
jgi:hypothetical protein